MIQVKVLMQTSNSNRAVLDKTLQNRYTAGIEKMMQLTTTRNKDHTCSNICMVGLSSTKRPDCESPMTRNAILNVLIAPKARRWGLIFIRIVFVQACSIRKRTERYDIKKFYPTKPVALGCIPPQYPGGGSKGSSSSRGVSLTRFLCEGAGPESSMDSDDN